MKKLNKKDFSALLLVGKNLQVTYEQTTPCYQTGKYKILATAYRVSSLGSREPIFFSIYKGNININ